MEGLLYIKKCGVVHSGYLLVLQSPQVCSFSDFVLCLTIYFKAYSSSCQKFFPTLRIWSLLHWIIPQVYLSRSLPSL